MNKFKEDVIAILALLLLGAILAGFFWAGYTAVTVLQKEILQAGLTLGDLYCEATHPTNNRITLSDPSISPSLPSPPFISPSGSAVRVYFRDGEAYCEYGLQTAESTNLVRCVPRRKAEKKFHYERNNASNEAYITPVGEFWQIFTREGGMETIKMEDAHLEVSACDWQDFHQPCLRFTVPDHTITFAGKPFTYTTPYPTPTYSKSPSSTTVGVGNTAWLEVNTISALPKQH